MKSDKEVIEKLIKQNSKLQSTNHILSKQITKLKKVAKVDENKYLKDSLDNMTAIHSKLVRKLKRDKLK